MRTGCRFARVIHPNSKALFLTLRKVTLSHRIQLVACFTQWTRIATTKSSSSFVPTAVAMCITNEDCSPAKVHC